MKHFMLIGICLLVVCSPCEAEVQPGDDFNAKTAIAASVLQRWYNSKGLWNTTGWWNAANCVQAIENVIVAENGGRYLQVLSKTFDDNSRGDFLNEYYDDEGWWALAWIRAFDLTGERRCLDMSKAIFADMVGGWDSHCDGGIWWRKDRRYKNAIANELFLLVAIRLHQRTPGDDGTDGYLNWAIREWAWFNASGMINAQHLVNDGLNRSCENNGRTTWSYNQGVIVGGLTELYKTTGDTNYLNEAATIADAAIATLNDGNGILREPCEPGGCGGGDVPQFKGIFVQNLAGLYDVTRNSAYYRFLISNARSVWTNDRDSASRFGLRWDGPIDRVDAARHSSAMMPISILAEPATADLVFAKGSGSPAFNHETGTFSGALAWTCGANTPRGLMLSGPYLESLLPGKHVAHFRLAVNATSHESEKLIRLEIRQADSETVLAAKDISWEEFAVSGESQDFSLKFVNQEVGDPLEFRVFWNGVSDAPVVTLIDVTVDGARNWTGANLTHEVGQLDGANAWCADPVRNPASGFLAKGANARGISPGNHEAVFELKVDNFNWDNSKVVVLSVVDADNEQIVASRDLLRNEFPTTLYQSMILKFTATAGHCYDFRTFWNFAPHAPRLTQRSLIVK